MSGDDQGPTMHTGMSLDLDESGEYASGVFKVCIFFYFVLFTILLYFQIMLHESGISFSNQNLVERIVILKV